MFRRIVTTIAGLALIMPLAGCLQQAPRRMGQAPVSDYPPPQTTPGEILTHSTNTDRVINRAETLIGQRRFDEARESLAQMDDDMVSEQTLAQKTLAIANIELKENHPQQALVKLRKIRSLDNFSTDEKIHYHAIKTQAYLQLNLTMQSIYERLKLQPLLSDEQNAINQNALWQSIQTLNHSQLETAASSKNQLLKGWAQLALINQNYQDDPSDFNKAIAIWRQRYTDHPGIAMLPEPAPVATQAPTEQTQHIALLLPTHGSLEKLAHAVRDGFMTAYQLDQSSDKPTITIIDTNNDRHIARSYQQAIDKGADFVVGPLTKQGVQQLAAIEKHPIKVLSLNKVDGVSAPSVTTFGLAPEDEARQSAELAWSQGHTHALIIALDNDWGHRVADAFAQTWETQGGTISDHLFFTAKSDLATPIRQLLHISDSQQRTRSLKNLLGEKVHADPRRRQDIDAIFVAAFSKEAKQIRPLLAYYYANDVPIYATSGVYEGHPDPTANKDLNQITFCDMPWVLTPKDTFADIHQMIKQLWPKQEAAYPRLYALGVDAYQLVPQLPRLEQFASMPYHGATGDLTLTADHSISRHLPCAHFAKGLVIPMRHS